MVTAKFQAPKEQSEPAQRAFWWGVAGVTWLLAAAHCKVREEQEKVNYTLLHSQEAACKGWQVPRLPRCQMLPMLRDGFEAEGKSLQSIV